MGGAGKWLLVGAIVFLLVSATADGEQTRTPAPTKPPGQSTPTDPGTAPQLPDEATYRPDVAAYVADDEIDWWRDNATIWHQQTEGYSGIYGVDAGDGVHTLQEGLDDEGAQKRHWRQMYYPASLVRLTDLSKQDLDNAHKLLSFSVNWQNYRRRDSEKLIDDDHTAADWQLGISIVGKVAGAFVPVFSIVEGYLSTIQNAVGVGSAAFDQAQLDQRKNIAAAMASLTVDQRQYLKARLCCPAAPQYTRRTDPATNDPYLEDAPHINSLEYSTDANSADAKAVYLGVQTRKWADPYGGTYYARNALFYPLIFHPASGYNAEVWGKVNRGENVDHWDSGCACVVHAIPQAQLDAAVDLYSEPRSYLRWSCEQLLGQNRADEARAGMKLRTVRRAYAYRTLDLLACLLFPDETFHQGLHYYRNPLFGEVRGSIFPPTAEDKLIPAGDFIASVAADVSSGSETAVQKAITTVASSDDVAMTAGVASMVGVTGSRFSKLV